MSWKFNPLTKKIDYYESASGDPGPPGEDGDDGASAYEVAVADGFEGNETAWLLSLVGPQGPKGETGSDATVTKAAVEAVLTGEISSHTHASSGGLSQPQVLSRGLGC